MKQYKLKRLSFILLMSVLFLYLPTPIHADTDDGYYEIDYEVLNADNDSVSVANDYFDKPAVLIVEDGKHTVQILINYSQWVVGLQAPVGDEFKEVEVLSEDTEDEEEQKRIVQFDIEDNHDLVDPVEMKMHIVVDILEEDYDHKYTARFNFDKDSMEKVDAPLFEAEVEEKESTEEDTESEEEVVNEKSDSSEKSNDASNPGTMIVIVLLVGIAIILIYSFGFKKKK